MRIGKATLVNNEMIANPGKNGYNSSVDYCSFVRENNLDAPIEEYLVSA